MDSVIELGIDVCKIEEDSHLLAPTIFPSLSGRLNRIPYDRSPKANNFLTPNHFLKVSTLYEEPVTKRF